MVWSSKTYYLILAIKCKLSLFRDGKLIWNKRERSLYYICIYAVYTFRVSRELLTRTTRCNITYGHERVGNSAWKRIHHLSLVIYFLFTIMYYNIALSRIMLVYLTPVSESIQLTTIFFLDCRYSSKSAA